MKGENGWPLLAGDQVVELVKTQLQYDNQKYQVTEQTLYEVCNAWNEWVYALKNW